ncbi:uncharacterized protein [Argopecten irradians]|uniref:uncharacterized protein n=1 Tax=Argopecten irradians TaxID=31199 RepID=UPI00371504F2
MANTSLVSSVAETGIRTMFHSTPSQPDSSTSNGQQQSPPSSQNALRSFPGVRCTLQKFGFSGDVANLVAASWKDSTQKQYRSYLSRWLQFCGEREINPYTPSLHLNSVLEFLTALYHQGLGYSAINTARSAISSLELSSNNPIGNHPLVRRLIKGVFASRPCLPRYSRTWNVSNVLNFLESLYPVNMLTLLDLTKKLAMLLALVTGQRGHYLHVLETTGIDFSENVMTLYTRNVLKTSRPGSHQVPIRVSKFHDKPALCVYSTMLAYLDRTELLRENTDLLFIGTVPPHKPVCRSSISRWIKSVMLSAGINVTEFGAHSTRAAATSAAAKRQVPLQQILKAAGWSNDCTFRRFYNRDSEQETDNSLSEIVNSV